MQDQLSNGKSSLPTDPVKRFEKTVRDWPMDIAGMDSADIRRLIQELQIHLMELEIQNEDVRAAQARMAESGGRFTELYDAAPVGHFTLDRKGYILEANLTSAEILHRDRGSILGTPLAKYLSKNDADVLNQHLLETLSSGSRDVRNLQLTLPEGGMRTIRFESTKIVNGWPPLCRTTIRDITEWSNAQKVAQRSARLAALGTLAAGIAHEVNNPLWMISLQAELALTSGDRPNRQEYVETCLQEIKRLVERGGRIIGSVLRFAKGDVSRKWLEPVASWLTRARDNTRHLAAKQNVAVELNIPENAPQVTVNPTEMEQVFVNLFSNAIESSKPAGRIHAAVSWDEKLVAIQVEDEGCGMSADQIKRIFDPFYTTRRNAGGTGLGLSISHQIIEDHHGTIDVTSQCGQGTTVTVRLPLSNEPKPQ